MSEVGKIVALLKSDAIEKQIEIKNGKRRTVEKKIFPGYVLVDMIVTDLCVLRRRRTKTSRRLSQHSVQSHERHKDERGGRNEGEGKVSASFKSVSQIAAPTI